MSLYGVCCARVSHFAFNVILNEWSRVVCSQETMEVRDGGIKRQTISNHEKWLKQKTGCHMPLSFTLYCTHAGRLT